MNQLVDELPRANPDWLAPDRVGFGSVVYTRELGTRQERAYRLVCGNPAPLDASQLSLTSPLGRALLQSRAGDQVFLDAPPAPRHLEVFSITTLPQALGMALGPGRAPAAHPPRSFPARPPL